MAKQNEGAATKPSPEQKKRDKATESLTAYIAKRFEKLGGSMAMQSTDAGKTLAPILLAPAVAPGNPAGRRAVPKALASATAEQIKGWHERVKSWGDHEWQKAAKRAGVTLTPPPKASRSRKPAAAIA